jgi:hypothetical protein
MLYLVPVPVFDPLRFVGTGDDTNVTIIFFCINCLVGTGTGKEYGTSQIPFMFAINLLSVNWICSRSNLDGYEGRQFAF